MQFKILVKYMMLNGHMNVHETPWRDLKGLSEETIPQCPRKFFNATI